MTIRFTLPYNNDDPEEFLATFEPYRKDIYSFYFGLPGIFAAHNPFQMSFENTCKTCSGTYEFLRLCTGKFQTVLCINTLVYPQEIESLKFTLARELGPLIEVYGLSAVNVASPTLADLIHGLFPALDIQTSCNTYTFINNMYRLWHEKYGSTVFNLPREALRTPWLLDQFRETGFVAKCLVNEGCIYGCPGNIEHACSFVIKDVAQRNFCDRPDFKLSDIFKSNFIPPHRLDEFEGKVDIAKIAGRTFETWRILDTFLAYLNRDPEADVTTLLHSRTRKLLVNNGISIKAKDWPKKTLTCECKECDTCVICRKAMEHAIKRQGLDPEKLSRPI